MMIRSFALALAATAAFALPALAGSSGTGRAGGLGTAMGNVSPSSPAYGTLSGVSSGTPGQGFGQKIAPDTYGHTKTPQQAPVKNNLTGKPF